MALVAEKPLSLRVKLNVTDIKAPGSRSLCTITLPGACRLTPRLVAAAVTRSSTACFSRVSALVATAAAIHPAFRCCAQAHVMSTSRREKDGAVARASLVMAWNNSVVDKSTTESRTRRQNQHRPPYVPASLLVRAPPVSRPTWQLLHVFGGHCITYLIALAPHVSLISASVWSNTCGACVVAARENSEHNRSL